MVSVPPGPTRTDPPVPYTALFRSVVGHDQRAQLHDRIAPAFEQHAFVAAAGVRDLEHRRVALARPQVHGAPRLHAERDAGLGFGSKRTVETAAAPGNLLRLPQHVVALAVLPRDHQNGRASGGGSICW